MHNSFCTSFGRAKANLTFFTWGLAAFTGPADATNDDFGWARMRSTLFKLEANLPQVRYSHSTLDLPLSDTIHLTAAGHLESGKRIARTIKAFYGFGGNPAHFEITAGNVLTATTTRVTVTLVGATDISPSSGITGFEVSGDGTTWVTATAARTDATHVTLTHSSIAGAPARKVRYQYGMGPNVTAPLRDNSVLALPCTYTRDVITPV
jgi:hypothetical protein